MDKINYHVSKEKKEYFKKLVELLAELIRVCEKNDINYFVIGGTLLGAIRHNGFIPWDDDIDVAMLRDDYNKLKSISSKEFKEPFFFQNPSTDMGNSKGISRLRNSLTTSIPYMDVAMNCNHGIFIDIFPLDVVPDDRDIFKTQMKELRRIRMVMNAYARYKSGFNTLGTTIKKKIAYWLIYPLFLLDILNNDKLYEKFEKVASKYKDYNYDKVGYISGLFNQDKYLHKKEWFEGKVLKHEFEGIVVNVPKDYHLILKQEYGDYMIPVQEPSHHGELEFSTVCPYPEYIKNNQERLKKIWLANTEVYRDSL